MWTRRFLNPVLVPIILLSTVLVLPPAGAHDGSAYDARGLSAVGQSLAGSQAAIGPSTTLSGWFHIIYGDAPSGPGLRTTSGYVLIDAAGQTTELVVDDGVLATVGGPRAINHQWVAVTGQSAALSFAAGGTAPVNVVQVQAILPIAAAAPVSAAPTPAVSGSQPWVTVLCRFADSTGVTPDPVSYFQNLILGTTAPGLDHYWREQSYNQVNILGSAVYGWYNLPQPRSYYIPGGSLDFGRAAQDCTGVADAAVYFPSFVGINLMFNDDLDGFAWGGSWTLTRDGVTKTYRMTWVPPWGYENQGPIAHEMGHGFGLPHSSGPYTATYDSRWDVMSDIWDNCPPYDPTYGCVGPHTISYHKDILGWIPADQRYVASSGTSQTITLERLGQPTTGNYLMAQIPIPGSSTQFYTVEVRRFAGYDAKLPGEAVIIHKVDTTRSDRDAQVVDPDNNGNPGDTAAMWLPGEIFTDSTNPISVAVVAQTATGFQATVTNGAATTYTLSVTVSGTGTVTSSPAGITCSAGACGASFPSGTSVTLTPSAGTLLSWSGACTGSAGCVVSMTAARSVTATFTAATYALTVSPTPTNGRITGTGISCGTGGTGDCSEAGLTGNVTLTAVPASGYQLGTWTGCSSASGTSCTVAMTQARTVTASFTALTYSLTISPAPVNGQITGPGISCGTGGTGDCSEAALSGSVTLTAVPATGYQLTAWTGCSNTSGTSCTVAMTQARTVTASFAVPTYFGLQPVATGLNSPVSITHAGDGSGRLFITLQAGQIVIFDGTHVLPTPFLDITDRVLAGGERGLLGLAFHPGYATNGFFYVSYTSKPIGDIVIAGYAVSADPNVANRDPETVLLTVPHSQFANHNGGQLQFGPDGYLYASVGDGGGSGDPGNNAQNLETLLGKLLRLDVDGSPPYVPSDNPFGNHIWALGLRNPWRFSFDRLTGDLFIGDVGQGTREEVDFQPAGSTGGANFCWKHREGTLSFDGLPCTGPGTPTAPILEYDHSAGNCSITGGYRYRGTAVPSLVGTYLYGDYCSGRIWGATFDGASWAASLLLDTPYTVSTFGEDEAGELYLTHYSASGTVYRVIKP